MSCPGCETNGIPKVLGINRALGEEPRRSETGWTKKGTVPCTSVVARINLCCGG